MEGDNLERVGWLAQQVAEGKGSSGGLSNRLAVGIDFMYLCLLVLSGFRSYEDKVR